MSGATYPYRKEEAAKSENITAAPRRNAARTYTCAAAAARRKRRRRGGISGTACGGGTRGRDGMSMAATPARVRHGAQKRARAPGIEGGAQLAAHRQVGRASSVNIRSSNAIRNSTS